MKYGTDAYDQWSVDELLAFAPSVAGGCFALARFSEASGRSGSVQIWKIPLEGGKPAQLTRRGGAEATRRVVSSR